MCACHRLGYLCPVFVCVSVMVTFIDFVFVFVFVVVFVFMNTIVSPQPLRLFLLLHRHPVVFFVLFVPRSGNRLRGGILLSSSIVGKRFLAKYGGFIKRAMV